VINTRFTAMFGLRHPLMSAPMAMHSGGTIAAAVSAAGAMGSFGGIHRTQGPEWVTAQADLVRSRTSAPFTIGFITAFLPFAEGHFEAAIAARPAAIALSFGDPGEWGRRVKDAGIRLICQVQNLNDLAAATAAGADVLVAQGNDAGGHTGTMAMLPLLSAIVQRAPGTPVLAAGGIGDGRTLAAALLAGADGAWLGTAFLATPEAVEVDDAYKTAIVESDGGDTVFTRAYDIASGLPWPAGIGERVRRDPFTDEWSGRETELEAQRGQVATGRPVLYGQSAGAISAVRPAADVVSSISEQAERTLQERPAALVRTTAAWPAHLPVAAVRVARPTNDLAAAVAFYRDALGLAEVGRFADHAGYDGVMLGLPGTGWHLELTASAGVDASVTTKENLLVLYLDDGAAVTEVVARLGAAGHHPVEAENPYWSASGAVTFEDPDGWRLVLFPGTAL
jgi:nitronate monooxygenase